MSKFSSDHGSQIIFDLIKVIQDNRNYLSEIDGQIGDGDHGINMNKGFTICEDRLKNSENVDFSKALKILGRVLMMEIGGSMGPLYGTLFIQMSKKCEDIEEIDAETFGKMLEAAIEGLNNIGNAKLGDKTMMDTLIPATNAYIKALEDGKDFKTSLLELKTAAEAGKESTRDLVAKIGRASRLGERSRGVLDAGATSCNLILQSLSDSMIKLMD